MEYIVVDQAILGCMRMCFKLRFAVQLVLIHEEVSGATVC